MKKSLLFFSLFVGLVACSSDKSSKRTIEDSGKQDVVEVLYFHGKQRCATCLAIEKHAKELIDAAYADELKNGSLFYRTIYLNEEEALADKYGVTWSSLIIVDYDNNGKEMSKNLTDLAFGNARTAPEKFKSALSEQISEMLKN